MKEPKEPRCILSDEELIKRSSAWISKLAKTGGQAWTLKVPVDFDNDPDMLFGELTNRLKAANEKTRLALAEQHKRTRYAAIEVIQEKVFKAENPIMDAIGGELIREIQNLKQP